MESRCLGKAIKSSLLGKVPFKISMAGLARADSALKAAKSDIAWIREAISNFCACIDSAFPLTSLERVTKSQLTSIKKPNIMQTGSIGKYISGFEVM